MALTHSRPFEVIDLRPLGGGLQQAVSTSLIKSDGLQLMRVVLRAGQGLPMHQVAGEITIHCIEGLASVDTPEHRCELPAGHGVLLPAAAPHAVNALQDSTLLVTVCLPGAATARA